MGLADVAPDAVQAAGLIPMDRPGTAVSRGLHGRLVEDPHSAHLPRGSDRGLPGVRHLVLDFPALDPFRPLVPH